MKKLTFCEFEKDNNSVTVRFDCNFVVTTAGDGLWGCEAGRKVTVNAIDLVTNAHDDEVYVSVNVMHDSEWDIYTDSAFTQAISEALGFKVSFTEQGMQDDGYASMEC
jgi:hypothetical protein